jgi:hypothetical protein
MTAHLPQTPERRQLLDDLLVLVHHGVVEVDHTPDGQPTFQLTPDGERLATEFVERALLRGWV